MDRVLRLLSGMGQGLVWFLISTESVAIIFTTLSLSPPIASLTLSPPLPPFSRSARTRVVVGMLRALDGLSFCLEHDPPKGRLSQS